jgi:hypothetical protein
MNYKDLSMFKISEIIKPFTLGTFLFSISINGMVKNQGIINQLLKTAHENKGKILLTSGAIATVWFGYQYRSLINEYLKSYVNTSTHKLDPSIYQSLDDHPEYKFADQEDLTFQMGREKISIDNSIGGIKIYTHDSSDFVLTIIKRALNPDDLIKIGQKISFIDSEKVNIETKRTANTLNAILHYILRVPKNYELTELTMKTDSGNIVLNDVKSKILTAEAKGSGSITAACLINFKAKTKNGDIMVKNLEDGNFETINGSISAENISVFGSFEAYSKKNGSISVKSASINYPPNFSFSITKDAIKLNAAKLNAKVHLTTENGGISSDFPLNNRVGSKKDIKAEIGEIGTDIAKHELTIFADGNIQLIK